MGVLMSKEFKTFLNETKQYLSEASTADATYTEMAICVAYNKKLNHKDPIKAAGISPSNWKKVSKSLQNTGTAVVNDSKLSNVGGVMIHSGAGSSKTKYPKPASDTTPKTDLYGSNKFRFSLKKSGDSGKGAQLMSAKSGEANGVIVGAIKHYEKNEKQNIANDKEFKEIFKILNDKMLKASRNDLNVEVSKGKGDFKKWYVSKASGRADEIKKILNDKSIKDSDIEKHMKDELGLLGATSMVKGDNIIDPKAQVSRNELDAYFADYMEGGVKVGDVTVSKKYLKSVDKKDLAGPALKAQVADLIKTSMDTLDWQNTISNWFSNNKSLKKWVVYEAASGMYKFTGKAIGGSDYAGPITAVANKMLVFHNKGVKKLEGVHKWSMANANLCDKVSVSFKGSGRSKYPKLGLAASYDLEKDFDTILNEEYDMLKQRMLQEGFFSNIKDKIVNTVKGFYENVIKRVMDKLIEYAQKGISAILYVLGLQISGYTVIKTPKW